MELFDTTFKALDLALGAAGKRQEVLANNLANVNTPGYKRLDVAFDETLAKALQAERTGDTSALDGLRAGVQTDQNVQVRADGNSVDIDQEMAFVAENNIRYNALVQLSQKKLEGLKYVISDGRR
ncbi:MAG: flagellar basal-body rod protein FlgB [Thermoleophilia bacterium]|nr:flagellar basal-body rod protein FlgB [Thermoleophilia bacterium]MCZ4496388.1 flagellar basal-body rod protein FlgB [Thermoleophilia bacterium]